MRISKLETFGNEFVCFVRLTTDTGEAGWGQTSTYNDRCCRELDEEI